MRRTVIVALVLLALFGLIWRGLDSPDNPLDGSLFAAYAVVFAFLGAYHASLAARERKLAAMPGSLRPSGSAAVELLEAAALASVPLGILLATLYAPQEATMGMIQRIFYVHVPSAWVAFVAFTVVAGASVVYLVRSSPAADRLARASAEVGVVFTTLVLLTGPIWARPVWGIWWTWDSRLTLTLVLWLVYVGYLMLRAYVPEPGRQARLAAVTGILGFVGVPIDYMAIRWWRTQHPQPVIGGGEKSGLDPHMRAAFFFLLAAFTVVYLALLLRRVALARLEEEAEGEPAGG